jgi:hypothetical protein
MKSELKLNKNKVQIYYKSWMIIQMNEIYGINICDKTIINEQS